MNALSAFRAAVRVCMAALIATLVGCVTTGTQIAASQGARLDQARIATGFNEIPAMPLPFDAPLVHRVGIERNDAPAIAVELGGERTFVALFTLPIWSEPYSIDLASMMFGGAADPAIFYPRYLLLNADFSVSRQSRAQDFVYRTGMGEGMVSSTVFVNEDNRNERFLAVVGEPRTSVVEHASLSQSVGSVPLILPVKGGSLMWLIRTGGNEGAKRMRAAVGGTIRVKADLYKPKRIGG